MKNIVLNAKDIPQLPKLKKESDNLVVSKHAWEEKWLTKGRGYLLEIDRLVKELRAEGRLIVGQMDITYEEFLEWCNEDSLAEWVDGKIIRYSPASFRHQELVDFLLTVISTFAQEKDLGRVINAPFQMKTGPDLPGREPDLIFVSKEREDLFAETHLQGPADLVVEIISPESRSRDKEEKFTEYEKGGIREYWLIDPDLKEAIFYIRDEGRFKWQELDASGVYHSRVLSGFQLKVEWLWQDPLPSNLEVFREIRLI